MVHTASPVSFAPDADVIAPAVDGTLSVLRAADEHGIKRVVLTSTVAAASQYVEGGETLNFDEECWGSTEEMEADKDLQPYYLGKTLAEKKAWEFREGKEFELVTILPGVVLGRSLTDYSNLSAQIFKSVA